jgi:hypothetical protein
MTNNARNTLTEELVRCKVWIENALAYSGDTHTFDDIALGVLGHRYQLWPLENSCAVTEFVEYPRQKHFHVFLAGGTLNEILQLNEPFAQFAKAHKCTAMTIAGRPGWEKILDKLGWEYQFTTLKREI